jgi:hypothetical protein
VIQRAAAFERQAQSLSFCKSSGLRGRLLLSQLDRHAIVGEKESIAIALCNPLNVSRILATIWLKNYGWMLLDNCCFRARLSAPGEKEKG